MAHLMTIDLEPSLLPCDQIGGIVQGMCQANIDFQEHSFLMAEQNLRAMLMVCKRKICSCVHRQPSSNIVRHRQMRYQKWVSFSGVQPGFIPAGAGFTQGKRNTRASGSVMRAWRRRIAMPQGIASSPLYRWNSCLCMLRMMQKIVNPGEA
eukprot:575837-Pelagomonas_calceolata.AAC.1